MKGNRQLWAVLGICLLGLAAVAVGRAFEPLPVGPNYPQTDLSQQPLWDVLSVLGPDSILISNGPKQQTIKLLGVASAQDEPEQPNGVDVDYDSSAVEFLNNLLAGEKIQVLTSSKTTPGQPTMGRVFRSPDGLYVNLELVRQGYTAMSPVGLTGNLAVFRAYERRAQLSGKGRWARLPPAIPAGKVAGEITVYITKSGKKYHKEDCAFLSKSKIAISLSQAKKRGFTPCKICKPTQ